MPTYLLGTLYFVCPYLVSIEGHTFISKVLLLGFVFLYTFLFPSMMVFWLHKRNKIGSIKLENLSERRLPYLISIVSSGFLAYFFYEKSSFLKPTAVIVIFIMVVIALVALLSLKWQVSAHAAGIGGVLGTFFTLKFHYDEPRLAIPFFITLILAGVIGSARLKLNAHNLAQIFVGLSIGIIVSIVGTLFI